MWCSMIMSDVYSSQEDSTDSADVDVDTDGRSSFRDLSELFDSSGVLSTGVFGLVRGTGLLISGGTRLRQPPNAMEEASAGLQRVSITSGKWFYTATVLSPGTGSIGFGRPADARAAWGLTQARTLAGVGADRAAPVPPTAPDGSVAQQWRAGDVVCCGFDADTRVVSLSLYSKRGPSGALLPNPTPYIATFAGVEGPLTPIITLGAGLDVEVNLGDTPFLVTPPPGYLSLQRCVVCCNASQPIVLSDGCCMVTFIHSSVMFDSSEHVI